MDVINAFWTLLIGYSLLQALVFFVLLVIQKKGNRQANLLLAFCSSSCGLLLLEEFVDITYGYEAMPHIIFAFSPLWYVIAPLLYLYIKSFSQPLWKISIKDAWHFLPAFMVGINSLEFYSFSATTKLNYLKNFAASGDIAPIHNLNYLLFLVQVILYLLAASFLIRQFMSAFIAQKDPIPTYAFWLKQLLNGMMLISCLGAINLFMVNGGHWLLQITEYLFILWLSGFIFILFYKNVTTPNQLFYTAPSLPNIFHNHHFKEDFLHHFSQLRGILEAEKPFLDPNYSIYTLAKKTGFSQNHISLLIKTNAHQNFREFINRYRIEEAKKRLTAPESRQFTIDSIAKECGFNSLATFYRIFKKEVGITPKQFIKSKNSVS